MNQPAKVQEPSMEEILASIRRIIADDDGNSTARPEEPSAASRQPAPSGGAEASAPANKHDDIDAMLAQLDTGLMRPPPPSLETEKAEPDVLDLTEAMTAPRPPEAAFRTIDGSSDVVFNEPEPEREPPRERAAEEIPRAPEAPQRPYAPPRPPSLADRPLISASTVAAVDGAFNSLAHTVIGQNARTLEDLVKEMLRPLLKSWLDDNLPGVVDRIVRAEIERVSRGR
jgi:uncharacterized protein